MRTKNEEKMRGIIKEHELIIEYLQSRKAKWETWLKELEESKKPKPVDVVPAPAVVSQ